MQTEAEGEAGEAAARTARTGAAAERQRRRGDGSNGGTRQRSKRFGGTRQREGEGGRQRSAAPGGGRGSAGARDAMAARGTGCCGAAASLRPGAHDGGARRSLAEDGQRQRPAWRSPGGLDPRQRLLPRPACPSSVSRECPRPLFLKIK